MSRDLEAEPANDAALFDMLHGLFGIGDFDDSGPVPWFRFRMTEICKLKAMRVRRGIGVSELAMAARYCVRHNQSVKESWELRGFLADAKREARRMAVPELSAQVSNAITCERTSPGLNSEHWIERLLLTRGPHRRDVLDEWKKARE